MSSVNIDQVAKVRTAHSLASRHQARTVDLIVSGARRLVPRGDHTSGSGERRAGRPLAQTLRVDHRVSWYTLSDLVGSDSRYAATVHQGSQPHFIHAKGKMLKFEWERGNIIVTARRGRKRGRSGPSGNYFFFKLVRHPGNKRPVRYLTTPMHLYGRLHGYRTASARVNRTRLP